MSGRPPLPAGFRITFDRRTRVADGGALLYGGVPWRMLRLSPTGARLAYRLRAGDPVGDPAAGALARRLVDAGLAQPVPPDGADDLPIEVVVPARDRPQELARCLAGLADLPVTVVDDGSADPTAVAAAAAGHGRARVLRREVNGGPAAARNTGLAGGTAAVVAFVDSDCRVGVEELRRLARHLADPTVAAVAPRIRPDLRDVRGRALAGYAAVASPLDLGDTAASARPGSPVGYVPSTVLVVRRAALEAAGGFDESMRVGEDVDLVWRLVDAGWSVRYDPSVVAAHTEPGSWAGWLRRRFGYGSSAGPLARRHGARVAGPSLRGLAAPVVVAGRLSRPGLPAAPALTAAATATAATVTGLLRWGLPLWWPALPLLLRSRRARLAAAAVVVGPRLLDRRRRRAGVDPLRFVAASLLDDLAYGAGVWRGSGRERTWRPLAPRLVASSAAASAAPPAVTG